MLKKLYYNSAFSSKTIVRDFLLWLIALVFLVVAAAEAGYYLYSDRLTHTRIQQRAETLVEEISSMLMAPLHNKDREMVTQICLICSQISDLYGMRIQDRDGELLFDTIKQDSHNFFQETDIKRDAEYLGHLTLVLSDRYHDQNRKQTLIAILFLGISLIVTMVVGIHIVMHYILIKPLQHFNRGLSKIAEGNYSTRLQAVKHTDLNSSVDAVNSMAGQIEKVVGQLSVTRDFLQNVLNSMPSIIVGVDRECYITNLNRAAVRSSGRSYVDCLGKKLADIFPSLAETVTANILESIVQRKPITIEQENCQIFGTKRCAEITVYPLHAESSDGAVVRVDDITSRTRLQEIMVQTEKMLSVGGLGAGMAHEINNPLGGILQATQNIERRLSPELEKNIEVAAQCGIEFEALRRYLHQREIFTMLSGIRDAGQRAAKIVQNMLQFSRHSDSFMESCDLAHILDRVLELANNEYDLKRQYDFRHFKIIRNYRHDLRVTCSKIEIEQVFLNLCKNAAQAYGPINGDSAHKTPEITINAYQDDTFVTVEIIDNGKGIAEDAKKRIFEPFFTTKAVGEGTGLGLAVSFFIVVDQHGGQLSVESTLGHGATFTVKLPRH